MNHGSRTINYKPKMTSDEAYEHLGPRVRKALQEAMQPWDAYWCLRMVRKHGADWVIKQIQLGDETFCRKGFIAGRGKRKPVPSSFVASKVSILRANW